MARGLRPLVSRGPWAGAVGRSGFRLRGQQYTDAEGRFSLVTIVPGLYPGRTRHIHVKAQAPNKPVLTTQPHFPGEARNARDGLYRADLLVTVTGRQTAAFNFVLA